MNPFGVFAAILFLLMLAFFVYAIVYAVALTRAAVRGYVKGFKQGLHQGDAVSQAEHIVADAQKH